MSPPPLLSVEGLTKVFPVRRGLWRKNVGQITAADQVSFSLRPGETFGLVGESGSGKSTVGRLILRLMEPTAGRILFRLDEEIDLLSLRGEPLRSFRRHMQMVLQDPYSSLNPRMPAFDILAEPLQAHGRKDRAFIEDKVRRLATDVGIDPGLLNRYPHAFSGGQRQRIALARALALRPELIVCDEPVSSLDVSVQAQIINLLKDLQAELGLAYLFIAHDLSVVAHVSHTVGIMYAGRIVEMADASELFNRPKHPYTEALLKAAPRSHPRERGMRQTPAGEVADLTNLPPGCAFHPRCPYTQPQCSEEKPHLMHADDGRSVACHFACDLALAGWAGWA